jgi:ABC-type amino acid transport substrate-binding protein
MKSVALSAVAPFVGTIDARAGQRRKAVVGVEITAPPFSFMEGDRYTGISNDILLRAAALKDLEISFTPLKFPALIPSVQAGQIDIAVSGIFVTEARKKIVDFSDPYYQQGAVWVAPVGSEVKSVQDLKGAKVAAEQGSAALALAQQEATKLGVEIRIFQDPATMQLAMQSGDVQAMIYDSGIMIHQVNVEKANPTIKLISDIVSPTGIAFAFEKGSDLVAVINDGMAQMRAKGEIAAIIAKYKM